MTDGSPFWRFSLRTYGVAGVPAACLELQDLAGADVNVLLYLLWLAVNGRRVDAAETSAVLAYVEPWRNEAVTPLRQARRFLREPPTGFDIQATSRLRTEVKKAELECERLQQEALHARRPLEEIGAPAEPYQAAMENVNAYERALSARFPEPARGRIVQAALTPSN